MLSLAGLSRRRLHQLATVRGGTPAVRVTVRARTASARTGVSRGDSGGGGGGGGGGGSGGGGSGSGKNSKQRRRDRLESNGEDAEEEKEEEEDDDVDGYFVLCEFRAPLGRLLLPPAARPTPTERQSWPGAVGGLKTATLLVDGFVHVMPRGAPTFCREVFGGRADPTRYRDRATPPPILGDFGRVESVSWVILLTRRTLIRL